MLNDFPPRSRPTARCRAPRVNATSHPHGQLVVPRSKQQIVELSAFDVSTVYDFVIRAIHNNSVDRDDAVRDEQLKSLGEGGAWLPHRLRSVSRSKPCRARADFVRRYFSGFHPAHRWSIPSARSNLRSIATRYVRTPDSVSLTLRPIWPVPRRTSQRSTSALTLLGALNRTAPGSGRASRGHRQGLGRLPVKRAEHTF